ncbi:carbohydrate transporter [Izhakiella australiensis]|uniref:D-ribose pyranase n=1 Tax=Izhakiella australiensis TaxID=1926881 RepID=A0A1S8YI99_9GAMM|nr:D-ribose pyranase [Izhakiella australiensis]OON38665.1 carbohydrate transporter [Izhakiella australiensis]
MRRDRILHPQLAQALATLGHSDILLVTDAGFPIPADARRIDLAFYPGMVDVLDILQVLRQEMFFDEIRMASEVPQCNPQLYDDVQRIFTGSGADFSALPHAQFLQQVPTRAKVVIRSGSLNPWANFAMTASTDPFAWFSEGMTPLAEYVERCRRIEENVVPELH